MFSKFLIRVQKVIGYLAIKHPFSTAAALIWGYGLKELTDMHRLRI